ncbi:YlxR family protein [Sanguibacter suaedae]|uniref:YlxR family protein n=1 Tax=Sanguibacter suaedae TaxID=2795737 RepID=A0A934IBV4_9MICO|nr:YlxR family protein [Sanguibacter suaedae]MBI9115537.1 YlxR family protein [Sanguibacter suaedae]
MGEERARLAEPGSRTRESSVPPRSSATDGEPLDTGRGGAGPTRTCVGCRARDAQAKMIRFVLSGDGVVDGVPVVVADPRRTSPGRGAWLHPNVRCGEIALRRKAFARALRVQGSVATGGIIDMLGSEPRMGTTRRQGSGSDADGHPMSTHR